MCVALDFRPCDMPAQLNRFYQVFFLSQFPADPRTYIMGHEATGIAIECVLLTFPCSEND